MAAPTAPSAQLSARGPSFSFRSLVLLVGSSCDTAHRDPRLPPTTYSVSLESPPFRCDLHVRIDIKVHRLGSLLEPILIVILLFHLMLSLLDIPRQSYSLLELWQEPALDR